ncbi:hypothetical protein F5Y14DRAFT_460020 [Nemania sp. NC0429]|nr:hypothetical protein F5Y14DRAFT_460020 [Nemania sp. NC0429]
MSSDSQTSGWFDPGCYFEPTPPTHASPSPRIPMPAVYRMTFRHVNCPGLMRKVGGRPSPYACDLRIPAWPSSVPYDLLNEMESMPYDIDGWTYDPDAATCYTESPPCRTCPYSIYYLLAVYTREYFNDSHMHHRHSKKGWGIRVVNAHIVWADPRPVFRDACREAGMDQYISISREQLALVQARGHIDHIHVEFETKHLMIPAQPCKQLKSEIKERFMRFAYRMMIRQLMKT